MLFPFSNPATGVPEPPGDFNSNYRHLKRLINKALKEGTPLEDLQLIPKSSSDEPRRRLSREDLLKLLQIIRRIRTKYQELLQPPVPKELERDILAKSVEARLPWETEALERAVATGCRRGAHPCPKRTQRSFEQRILSKIVALHQFSGYRSNSFPHLLVFLKASIWGFAFVGQ
jgi:hypothetical protein